MLAAGGRGEEGGRFFARPGYINYARPGHINIKMKEGDRGMIHWAMCLIVFWEINIHSLGTHISDDTPVFRSHVALEFAHDASVFTEGLAWYQGALVESGGMWGKSAIRMYRLEEGTPYKTKVIA